jgi:hypothetical protein
MTKSTWTQEQNNILLEYCNKKITIQEIAIALDKKVGDVKYHIGDLAVADFKNGISKENLMNKYNLTMNQVNGSINRVENKGKEKEKTTSTIITRSKDKDNIGNKGKSTNSVTNEDVFIVIELLKEIRDILKSSKK